MSTFSHAVLRQVLNQWHWTPADHPRPFPGPLTEPNQLNAWLDEIQTGARGHNISQKHWVNVALSWIPAAAPGKAGLRESLLRTMREKADSGEWTRENGRFWPWDRFRALLLEMCSWEGAKKFLTVTAAAVGSAVALPLIGLPLLGAIGFTSAGVAGGSLAAGFQSAFLGGATGGAFSVLQSIGARAAFPVAWNAVAGAVGARAAAAATAGNDDALTIVPGVDKLGDIGDD